MGLTNKVPEKDVQQTFNKIAGNYDKLNSIMSLGTHQKWRQKATAKIVVNPSKILDLCCGTADWTIMLARRYQHADIIGADFSSEMLKIAQQKVGASQLTNITLENGDAMNLRYPDNSFDVVTIGFGLRNVPDANKVLQEIYRILKPGGQLICLEAFKVETPVIKLGWKVYFNRLMPLMGKVFAKSPSEYKYLDDSVNKFVSIKQLAEMMNAAGFKNIEVDDLMFKAAAIHSAFK
ncbi:demethylmenaquinone methyltransferase [Companilactobacillus crustorum]|uniref:Demethylmenaquinone methyltransferase n=3 Tax=Companilactobacillus TaxID=2767879 RepID=A0A837RKI3_9LACO|nr:bifunctional demethylmenaquinone methyltransferase/2-methoxy-6-polyprenyl-1,4-benzoquinol methylase UbiE [Companilactobacillus crustorum]KRK43370.1 Ubiquinone menaquinone biosynthesis methyltransferase ubiE [Companilactobacillus crustorum JCM 15951]KRO20919.1 Ubiquinone menaquinone biosynthesis methyltransferase ubiE [Companilactobacillus crustorum]WDT65302.1 bifunctional demethylmenaquinone methyltransferase/2-methoxy-6-polyprenyl-1,4-benzoquinol methylase UbiE [Companilactobacillus crustoru